MALNFLNNGYFAGSVGIGEQSPSAKLQITTPFASSPSDCIFLFNNGSNTPGGGSEIIFGSSTSATPVNYNAKIQVLRSALDNGSSDMRFLTTHVATAVFPDTKMIIKSDGNVGIGTTSPTRKFVVSNGGASGIEIEPNYVSGVNEILSFNRTPGATAYETMRFNGGDFQFQIGGTERMRINSAGAVLINATAVKESASKLSVQGGMSEFETTLTNGNDWANSPISILERGNIGSGSADDKYSPNLNFHWSGRVSNSLWMSDNGHLNWGSYTSAGVPAADGVFRTKEINLIGTGRITGVDTVSASTDAANKAYVDAHGGGLGPFLPLAGGTMTGTNGVLMPDNFRLKIGTSEDLLIFHDGTDSQIFNQAGDLKIRNDQNDGDIVFMSDNGSGGVENYIQIDGSEGRTLFNKNIRLNDNVKAQFGGSGDFNIFHNGLNSYIENDTGDLYIRSNFQDRDIILQSDNGGGGIATYIQIDGSTGAVDLNHYGTKKFETTSTGFKWYGDAVNGSNGNLIMGGGQVKFNDSGRLFMGDSNDLQIYHDGSNSYIQDVGSGNLNITSSGGSVQINKGLSENMAEFIVDGAVKLYYDSAKKFETTAGGTINTGTIDSTGTITVTGANGNVGINTDTGKLLLGASYDLQIYHDGSHSYINDAGSGALKILASQLEINNAANTENIATFTQDGAVSLFYNNAKKFETTSAGVTITGGWVTSGVSVAQANVEHTDNTKALFGNGNDLQIYHDGSNSYIKDTGTGSIIINTDFFRILNSAGNSQMFRCDANDSVQLYYNNSVKLVTTNTGVTLTGAATATTFLGDLNGTINTATTGVTQVNSVDNTTIATTAYVNNKIALIPAGLVFQGTWNAATNTPTLTSGSGTTGNFYIVSTPGNTNLDGITDWKTGDWAVFIEQGASDQWEKIDNSSVLDGFGTGGSVAGWAGSGTSNTLTNSPITFSGNNVSFAGDVNIAEKLIHSGDTNTYLQFPGTNDKIVFATNGSDVLTLDAANTATFAGDVAIQKTGDVYLTLESTDATTTEEVAVKYSNQSTGSNYWWSGLNQSANYSLAYGTSYSGANVKMEISTAGNATFAGNVTLNGDGKLLKFTPTSYDDVELGIDSNGFVIYNTTDARYDLKINGDGNATFAGSITAPDFRGTSQFYLTSPDSWIFRSTGGVERMRITSAGNVGIGTTSPGAKLEVRSDGSAAGGAEIRLQHANNNTNDVVSTVNFANNAGSVGMIQAGTAGANNTGYIALFTDIAGSSSERMRVHTNGNVGIGTDSPLGKLMVRADTAGEPTRLIVSNNGTVQSGTSARLSFYEGTSEKGYIERRRDGSGKMAFYTPADDNPFVWENPSGEIMRITNSKVGIGTTSPTDPLTVTSTSNSLGIRLNYPVTNSLVYPFYVGNAAGTSYVRANNTAIAFKKNGGACTLKTEGSTNDLIIESASNLSFKTNGTLNTRMTILAAGNVGIGTTSPTAKLHVAGTGLFTGLVSGITPVAAANFVTKAYVDGSGGGTGPFLPLAGGTLSGTLNITQTTSDFIDLTRDLATDQTWRQAISGAGSFSLYDVTRGADVFTLDTSGDATFAGDVTATANYSAGNSKIIYKAQRSGGAVAGDWSYDDATTDMSLGTSTAHSFSLKTGNTRALTINSSQNATFAGSVVSNAIVQANGFRTTTGSTDYSLLTRNSSNTAVYIQQAGSGNILDVRYGSQAAGQGTSAFAVNSSGNVGIGTTSPRGKLDIVGNTDNDSDFLTIQDDDASAGSHRPSIRFRSNTAQIGQIVGLNGSMRFSSGTTENSMLEILDNGNVGIGTTSPDNRLDVVASDVNITPNAESSAVFRRNGNNYLTILSNASNEGGILFGNAVDDNDGSVSYKHNTQSMQFATADVERMRITSTGNVGIGDASPTSISANTFSLSVNSSRSDLSGALISKANGTVKHQQYWDSSGYSFNLSANSGNFQFNGGNVGIGTTSPGAKLDVVVSDVSVVPNGNSSAVFRRNGDNYISILSSTTGEGGVLFGNSSDAVDGWLAYKNGSGNQYMSMGTADAERMRITSSGNVGIGTTGPGEKLEVAGNIQAYGATFQGTTSSVIALKTSGATLRANIIGNNNGLELGVFGTNSINFEWDGVTKIQMKSTGRLGIGTGTAGPDSLLEIEGATNSSTSNLLRLSRATQGSTPEKVAGFYSGTSGEKGYITVNNFGTAYNTSSDYRLKENIKPIDDSVERLMSLKPCNFNFISEDEDKVVMDGFIAHEAKEVVPESVTGIKDAVDEEGNPAYQGIDQSKLVPLLTAALQKALQRIEILEQKINN